MRALTLTQPWAGLVAAGIKRIENRPRSMIRREDFGRPFALHASRDIDPGVYSAVERIAPELFEERGNHTLRPWYKLGRITSAVIAVATIDKVFDGGWDAESIARHADMLSDSRGNLLGPDQVRWFFGPIGYVLRDVRTLAKPVPCRGQRGFWNLTSRSERERGEWSAVERDVMEQLEATR